MQHSDSDTDAMSVASAIGEDGEEDVFAAAAILPDADGDGIFDLPASPMPGEGTADLGGFDEGGEEGGEEGDGDGEGSGDDGSGEGSGEESEERQAAMVAQLREALLARGYEMRDAPARPAQLPSFDIAGFAQRLASCPPRSVVVLCGAGISVSAGIPDFRSPGTGLYDNLQKYDLPSPQAIFELSYFRERPDAFYLLAREMWPDNFQPTPAHHFVALLHAKGLLRRCFTQNIDSLEARAGLPADLTIAAHGNFDGCHCIETGEPVPLGEVRRAVAVGREGPGGWAELAERYGGLCKPDIVFFGEQLPARFFEAAEADLPAAEARHRPLYPLYTPFIPPYTCLRRRRALAASAPAGGEAAGPASRPAGVQPFASLLGRCGLATPRLLLNREMLGEGEGELVGEADPMVRMLGLRDPRAMLHGDEANHRDAFFEGDCDAGVLELARLLG
ncbi:hypothetical protein EMIHUDRAFT_110864 [Emiliania huxleyi CCMP1516]|uniref:Deacetylase sirtuin-type domain-containing protein n=2 Tax=Emiliania huxleyi TaxID=2903 RepID=A0A0D3KHD3_EMIH1|nr:hypothetical protein EMIHUDRAFT_110864 [Emiliania huxleyi CCMP1516]EOD35168.1 hypothetical protein EMIHUDRAFT_110864 [Emiliania huxleyi CCMP1516]|eukprot:XP_005787597.1 hypothetical protein EMIHUDRAFT_110864 [Emiliania huxleyi CCMP1516]